MSASRPVAASRSEEGSGTALSALTSWFQYVGRVLYEFVDWSVA